MNQTSSKKRIVIKNRFSDVKEEITPGPCDYLKYELERENKYKGITIPKNTVEIGDIKDEDNQDLGPGCYKINEDFVRRKNYKCMIKPPKPPKSKVKNIQDVVDNIQKIPSIQSCQQQLQKFTTLDIENLEVIKDHERRGPGVYLHEKVNSMETE